MDFRTAQVLWIRDPHRDTFEHEPETYREARIENGCLEIRRDGQVTTYPPHTYQWVRWLAPI